MYNFKQAKKTLTYRRVFAALKTNWKLKRLIIRRLRDAERSTTKEMLIEAFTAIKARASSKNTSKIWGYARAERVALTLVLKRNEFKYKQAFQKFVENSVFLKKRDAALKGILLTVHSRYYRDHFLRWKTESERQKTMEDAEEHGEVVQQIFCLNRDIKNLKLQLLEDGYTIKEVNDILD